LKNECNMSHVALGCGAWRDYLRGRWEKGDMMRIW